MLDVSQWTVTVDGQHPRNWCAQAAGSARTALLYRHWTTLRPGSWAAEVDLSLRSDRSVGVSVCRCLSLFD